MTMAPDDPRHGTANGYVNRKCRCQRCKTAWAAEHQRLKDNRAERLRRDPSLAPHGRPSTYGNWGCRCQPCTTAWTVETNERDKRRRARRKAAMA